MESGGITPISMEGAIGKRKANMLNQQQLDNFKPFLPKLAPIHYPFVAPIPRRKPETMALRKISPPATLAFEDIKAIQARYGISVPQS